ncbi:hypothetical protein M3J09_000306 [Ascochyta lentis]
MNTQYIARHANGSSNSLLHRASAPPFSKQRTSDAQLASRKPWNVPLRLTIARSCPVAAAVRLAPAASKRRTYPLSALRHLAPSFRPFPLRLNATRGLSNTMATASRTCKRSIAPITTPPVENDCS